MLKKYDRLLYEALIEKALISKETLGPLLKEMDVSGEILQQILVRKGLLLEKDILNVLAEKLKLECLNLQGLSVDKSVLAKVPAKVASYYKFLPIKIKGRILTIAVASPLDIKTQDEIRTQLGYDIELVFSCQKDILDSIKRCYDIVDETVEKIASQQALVSEAVSQGISLEKVEDIEKLAENASVIKLVNQIISEGWRNRATDIHIEPYREKVFIRYRVDGVLYDTNVSPVIKNFLNAIISRIKIISNLNIVERRLPQDGRAIVRVQEQVLDLRISTIPTPFGESVVIRILPTQMLFSLERLGLAKNNLQIFDGLIRKPHGIIFVTGPTGSGKTTTLYASLGRINTKERKIITIEDPIEYEMPGIIQMQVMPEIGLDFARGLRSILRHDPDVIMVGEVRDLETAEIAIRVALTGHLVFSTLHTNDAASGIARLVDIGIDPYLIASSVIAFIAQRLVRVICPHCKYEDEEPLRELRQNIARDIGSRSFKDIKIFRGKGCQDCNFTGFLGRTAIYEILLSTEPIKELILKTVPSTEIKKKAVSLGMHTLLQDGWQKVIQGTTTPEEVLRVVSAEGYGVQEIASRRLQPKVEADDFDEKRVYKRLDSRVNIRYKVLKKEEQLSKKEVSVEKLAITENVSAGGIAFIGYEDLPRDSILNISLDLPDGGKLLECLARVARVKDQGGSEYEIGLCFLDLTGGERTRLDKYVSKGLES